MSQEFPIFQLFEVKTTSFSQIHFPKFSGENPGSGRKPAISSVNDVQPELLKILYNLPPDFEIQVKDAEEKSGIKREHFIYGLSVFLILYMIAGSEAGILCNIICFVYPAVVSIQAAEKREAGKAFAMLLYWVIFASFSLTDFYADRIMKVFPLYWVSKCIYCMYLYLPQTEGIYITEEKVIRPALQKFSKK